MDNLNNRPEIKIYPVETFYPDPHWGQNGSNQAADDNRRPGRNGRRPDEDRYLHRLVGKSVTVHTASAGQVRGVLAAVLSEAIIIRTDRGQLLVHDWDIAAILSE